MSYITEIFARAHIQQMSEFLLSGTELREISQASYEQRLKDCTEKALAVINAPPSKNEDQREQREDECMDTLCDYGDIYMEIGLRAGLLLAAQLFPFNAL